MHLLMNHLQVLNDGAGKRYFLYDIIQLLEKRSLFISLLVEFSFTEHAAVNKFQVAVSL
jgi:hypothetical protein